MDPYDVLGLADTLEGPLRRAFLELVVATDARIPLPLLRDLIARGDVIGMWRVLSALVQETVLEAGGGMEDVLIRGVMQGYEEEPLTLEASLQMANPYAERYARSRGPVLARGITAPNLAIVDAVIRDAVERGTDPKEVARSLARLVGPIPQHQEALRRYEQALREAGNPKAEEMVARYRQRLIRYRARMIARTEAIRATNMGQLYRWAAQHRDRPVEVYWVVTFDDRLCKWCAPMAGQTVMLADLVSGDRERWFVSTHVGFPGGVVEAQRRRDRDVEEAETRGGPAPLPPVSADPFAITGQRALGEEINREVTGRGGLRLRDEVVYRQSPPLHPNCRCGLGIRFLDSLT
jgi:hypothetical protein